MITFSHSKRLEELSGERMRSPGPGNYQNIDINLVKVKNPKWRIGSETRSPKVVTTNPGPGTYTVDKIKNPGCKFTFGSRSISPNNSALGGVSKIPGPGSYSEDYFKKFYFKNEPKYSFGIKDNKSLSNNKTTSPGPGTYNPDLQAFQKAPCVIMGHSKREQLALNLKTPGPASYQYSSLTGKESPRYGFGTSVRNQKDAEKSGRTPGPGTYHLEKMFSLLRKNGIAMSPRLPSDLGKFNAIPGPGTYQPNAIRTPHAIKIGTQPRDSKQGNNFPGPGTYQYDRFNKLKNSPHITMASRPQSGKVEKTPGPGTYEIPQRLVEGPRYNFGTKAEIQDSHIKQKLPGPGAYSAKENIVRSRSVSPIFGTSIRKDDSNYKLIPGPGQYDFKEKKDGPRYSFGIGTRSNSNSNKNSGPGPGSYNIKRDVARFQKDEKMHQIQQIKV